MPKRIILLLSILLVWTSQSYAFWMWTPETNKWINPKYAVKDTPQEQLAFAKESFDAKDYKTAINEFDKLIRYYPRAKEAPEAKYYIGQSWEAQGRLYDAFKSYQEVIDKYPFSDRAPDIVAQQYEVGNKLMEGGKTGMFTGGILGGSDYDVVEIFRKVIKNAPYGEFAAPSQYKIGLYLMGKQLYDEARDELDKVINDYPTSEWAKAAQYQIALVDAKRSTDAQYDQKITQSAVQEFKEFVKTNPDAELSAKAQQQIDQLREKDAENNFVVAHFYEKQKNYKAARIYYETVVEHFNNSPWAVKSMEKLRILDAKK